MKVVLHKSQLQVAQDQHRFRIVCAGRRWGKSVLSQLITLQWAAKASGLYWIVSPTYRQGKQIHWLGLQRLLAKTDWVVKKNEVELSITLKNGSIIELKGAENPDSLKGVGLRGLVIDEIATIKNFDWLWKEALSATLIDYEAPAIFISTPKGYNHFHRLVKSGDHENKIEGEVYVDGKVLTLEQYLDKDFKSWRFTSYDNPYIKQEEIEKAKIRSTDTYFNQEYLAKFSKYTGLVYKEFQREVHIIEPFSIPETFSIYRSIDFGSTNPTAVLWIAVDGDDNWYITNEHYETGQTIDYHAGRINSMSVSRQIVASYGDPSGAQWISEFAQRGIYITPANKEIGTNFNSWIRFGIEKVSEKLKLKPGHYVSSLPQKASLHESSTKGMPMVFIFSTCTNTIREFETYRWKEKSVTQAQDLNEPDVPEKANDHCFTGDTMILTKTGWKRIDKIKKGEYVWSPFGWNEVYRASSTGIKKVKDYGVFRCTPDHKILTTRGLVKVDKLRHSDKIMVWLKARQFTFKEFLTGVTQLPLKDQIGFIFDTLLTKSLMARQAFYTETYGNTIRAKFLMDIWFIILVGIHLTMILLTLSWLLFQNMQNATNGVFGKVWKNILKKQEKKQYFGIKAKLVEVGIVSTLKTLGKDVFKQERIAKFVRNCMKHPFLVEANFAVIIAKQQLLEDEEVYNLATKFGCYFANGVLVSNSMDALRYFAVSYEGQVKPYIAPKDDIMNRNWSLE